MEGAEVLINYLPEEEDDAQTTKQHVEKYGGKCQLYAADIRTQENCKRLIDITVEKLGGLDILINNAAYQNVVKDISELTEYGILYLPLQCC